METWSWTSLHSFSFWYFLPLQEYTLINHKSEQCVFCSPFLHIVYHPCWILVSLTDFQKKWKWKLLSCVRLCDNMDYIVHGILQARILEWVAFPFSRGSSQPRDQNPDLPHCRWILYQLSHKESPKAGSIWKMLIPQYNSLFSTFSSCLHSTF